MHAYTSEYSIRPNAFVPSLRVINSGPLRGAPSAAAAAVATIRKIAGYLADGRYRDAASTTSRYVAHERERALRRWTRVENLYARARARYAREKIDVNT